MRGGLIYTQRFLVPFLYFLQAMHNLLWPCMVRKFPHTHKKSTTSLDSFANQSSGYHTVWCCATRQDVSWGQRYVRWHQGKSRLEICHVEFHTKDEEHWVLCLLLPPHYSLFFVFVSSLHIFLRWAPKNEALCWWCPEGISHFVSSSNLHLNLLELEMRTWKLSFV